MATKGFEVINRQRGGEVAQRVKCLPYKNKDLIPILHVKRKMGVVVAHTNSRAGAADTG